MFVLLLVVTSLICNSTHRNSVPFVIDSFEYHMMGVNLAKGHGISVIGVYGDINDYKFDFSINNNLEFPTSELLFKIAYRLKGINYFFRDPGYPFFLGFIYKLFGINPIAVKYIQLVMLCFTIGFMPFLYRRWLGSSGWTIGTLSILPLAIIYFPSSQLFLTETLQIFILFLFFLILSGKLDIFKIIISGLLFSLLLMIKITVVFLLPFVLIYVFVKMEDAKYISSLVFLFFLLLIPSVWSVHANNVNQKQKQLCEQGIELLKDNDLSDLKDKIITSSLDKKTKTLLLENEFNLQDEKPRDYRFFNPGFFLMIDEVLRSSENFFISQRSKYSLLDVNNEYIFQEDESWIAWRTHKDSFYNLKISLGYNKQLFLLALFVIGNITTFLKIFMTKFVLLILKSTPLILPYLLSRTSKYGLSLYVKYILVIVFIILYFYFNQILANPTIILVGLVSLVALSIYQLARRPHQSLGYNSNFILFYALYFSYVFFALLVLPNERLLSIFFIFLLPFSFSNFVSNEKPDKTQMRAGD